MSNLIDLLARIRANFEILEELDPDGDWRHHRLVCTYRQGRYQLNDDQLTDLDLLLTESVQNVKIAKRYDQLQIF